jgi:polysaccharide biosynthesis transport protein
VDLRRLIAVVRTWLPLFVLAAVVAAAAGLVVSLVQPKTYEARSTLIVGQALSSVNPDYNQLLVSQRLSTTYAAVVKTRPILDAVSTQLHLTDTPDALAARIKVDAPLDSTLLTITVQDRDPAAAAALANAIAAKLIAASPAVQGREEAFQQSIDAQLAATQDQIATAQARAASLAGLESPTPETDAELQALETRLASLRSTYATLLSFAAGSATNLLSVVDPAVASTEPVAPRPLLNMLLAAALALIVVGGIVFLLETLDDSIKDAEMVRETTGLSTLGIIGRMKGDRGRPELYRLTTLLYPRSATTEAYRTLRTNVAFATVDAPARTLLVTSSVPGDGKTVTAANLAVVMAQADSRVILVDADLRKPGTHEMFNLPNIRGLTTLLANDRIDLAMVLQDTEQPGLRILATGPLPPNPAELLGSQRMRQVLERLGGVADIVVIDSPPVHAVTDAAVISSYVDGVLLVVDASRGRRRAVRESREALARSGATVLGVVLNRVPNAAGSEYGGYYASEPPDGSAPAAIGPLDLQGKPGRAPRVG